jgi:hypothetical protein
MGGGYRVVVVEVRGECKESSVDWRSVFHFGCGVALFTKERNQNQNRRRLGCLFVHSCFYQIYLGKQQRFVAVCVSFNPQPSHRPRSPARTARLGWWRVSTTPASPRWWRVSNRTLTVRERPSVTFQNHLMLRFYAQARFTTRSGLRRRLPFASRTCHTRSRLKPSASSTGDWRR